MIAIKFRSTAKLHPYQTQPDAALQAFSQLGFDDTALSGPWEWTYDGNPAQSPFLTI